MIPIRIVDAESHSAPGLKAVVAVNVAVFLWELSLGPHLDEVVRQLGLVPARMTLYWQLAPLRVWDWAPNLVTAMFLHGGWLHILGNMWFLWVFGRCLEARIGTGRFLAVYFLGGIFASLFHVWMHPQDPTPMIGASGAVASILGAFLVLGPLRPVLVLFPIVFIPLLFELPAVLVLTLWFLEQVIAGTFSLTRTAGHAAGVAWWAHVGGFVSGSLLVRLLGESSWRGRPEEAWERLGPVSGPWGLGKPYLGSPMRRPQGVPEDREVITVYDRWGRPVARYVVPRISEDDEDPGR